MTDEATESLDRVRRLLGGRYLVEREAGRGATAIVYLAQDTVRECAVAVKVLRAEFGAAVTAARFTREIRIGRELDHPNIVPVYEFGAVDDELYYTMPFVEGATLRDRLRRDGQLAIHEAIDIARQVAAALDYAHARGVIHRDVKPANILISSDRVAVADFGIARLSEHKPGDTLTDSGLAIGTPEYMSPEQAGAQKTLDGRTDTYALGCVLYEMLAGEPPFTGPTAQSIFARHFAEPPRSLRVVRPTVPYGVERAIERALAKVPADRFETAGEFITALDDAEAAPPLASAPQKRARRIALVAGGVTLTLIASGWGAQQLMRRADATAVAQADTATLAVMPIEGNADSSWAGGAERAFRQALVRWNGIDVLDPAAVREAIGNRVTLSNSDARRTALGLKAGRYVRLSAARDGETRRVTGTLYDVSRPTSALGEATISLTSSVANVDSQVVRLADRLLLRPADSTVFAESPVGTASLPAFQAFLRGREEIERWDLAAADSQYSRAMQFDARYARASLWLALVRLWSARDRTTWSHQVEVAASGRAQVPSADQPKLDAMTLLVRDEVPAACAVWDRHTAAAPFDFTAWYGAANCLGKDRAVIPDARSPSHWRFRSGYHSAIVRYRRALELKPAILSAMSANAFEPVREWLWTSGNAVRNGKSGSESITNYFAYASLDHDTLAFVPFRGDLFMAADPATMRLIPRTLDVAARRQRELFRDIAQSWVASNPSSASAEHALSVALFYLGDQSALSHIVQAAKLTSDPSDKQRLLSTELWMRVQLALPNDLTELRAVRVRADSLIRTVDTSAVEPQMLASLAAVLGRASDALRIDRRIARGATLTSATPATRMSRTLLLYAAFGGPADSLRALERRIDSLIVIVERTERRPAVQAELLVRAAQVAFTEHVFDLSRSSNARGAYLLAAQAAFLRADTGAVRAILANIRSVREESALPEIGIDAVYPEAWLLASIGDVRGAIAWLDPALTKVRLSTSLMDPVRAAMLVRAMAFRAELAEKTGDHTTAVRWAAAVVALWADADAFLQALVQRMRRLMQ